MPDYERMYAILCGAASDAMDALSLSSENIEIYKILHEALEKTENIYIGEEKATA